MEIVFWWPQQTSGGGGQSPKTIRASVGAAEMAAPLCVWRASSLASSPSSAAACFLRRGDNNEARRLRHHQWCNAPHTTTEPAASLISESGPISSQLGAGGGPQLAIGLQSLSLSVIEHNCPLTCAISKLAIGAQRLRTDCQSGLGLGRPSGGTQFGGPQICMRASGLGSGGGKGAVVAPFVFCYTQTRTKFGKRFAS